MARSIFLVSFITLSLHQSMRKGIMIFCFLLCFHRSRPWCFLEFSIGNYTRYTHVFPQRILTQYVFFNAWNKLVYYFDKVLNCILCCYPIDCFGEIRFQLRIIVVCLYTRGNTCLYIISQKRKHIIFIIFIIITRY